MRLVLAALSRPITVVVALVAIALLAALALQRMPVDIFPQVGDPAIYVAQPYGGMDPAQMEGYMTYYFEYHFLYITGIDRVESKSIQGAALMKLVFHEGTNMSQAMAETVGYVDRARAFMPPGAVPPFITRFDAGSVAVGQLVFSSATHTQGELQDFALNRVRPLFATLPGVSAPPPFGGNQRTIVVTLDPDKLQQYRISPDEAIAAVSKATLVMPSGNMWTGKLERIARTNAALGANLSELLSTPIRPGSGTTVYLRDIGTIENGTDIVTAYAHVNGKRTVYIPVTKRADASTLAVIDAVKAAIPDFRKAVPEDVDIRLEFDQSPFVTEFDSRPGDRRPAGRGADGSDGADLPARLAQRGDRRHEHSVRAAGRGDAALGYGSEHQHHDARRAGAGGRRAGGRSDGRDREHSHADAAGRLARPRGGGSVQPNGDGAPALDVLRSGGIRAFVFHGRGRAAALRSAVAGGGVFDDRVLPAVEQPGSGVFHVADEGSAPRRRSWLRSVYERYLGATLRFRWPLAAVYLVGSIALVWVLVPTNRNRAFSGIEVSADPHSPESAHGDAR